MRDRVCVVCVCVQREQGGLGVKIVGKQVVSISMVTIARVTFERGRLVLRNCFFFFVSVHKGGKSIWHDRKIISLLAIKIAELSPNSVNRP